MEKNYSVKEMWNKASGAALAVGIIPITVALVSILFEKWTGTSTLANIAKGFIAFLLWAAKFAGCIYMMRYFMENFQKSFKEVNKSDLFKFGSIIAVLSALLVASYELIDIIYLEPEKIDMVKELFNSPIYAKLDANSLDMLDKMTDHFPQITFISNFIYCSLYGVVLSAIIAGRLVSSNPFEK